MDVGHRAGAGEARVDVYQLGAPLLGPHDPTKRHRVALGHVRAHDRDDVRVRDVARKGGSCSPSETYAQTGHGRAMSYAGLILDGYHADCAHQLGVRVVEL